MTLLDNVPSVFALPEAKTESYYSFNVNVDLNPEGRIKIFFDCRVPVRVFISDTVKKCNESNCDRVIMPHEVPKDIIPFKNNRRELF